MNKTLIITLEYPPAVGGIASYVYNVAAHVSPEQVVIYAPRMVGDTDFDGQHQWKVFRYRPYWLLWPRWLRMFFQVRHIIKREKILELHIHHALPVGYIGWLMKKLFKIPYVIFLHGTDLEMAIRSSFKRRRLLQVTREAQRIVVNSHFLKDKLMQRLEGIPPVEVVYPCPADFFFESVDAQILRKLKATLALEGKKVLITIARMVEGKGYPHVIRLLPEIIHQIPNVAWLVIGDGPKYKMIFEQAQKLHLQNIIRYEGTVPYNELPQYLQLADLFVLLTHPDENHEEGWGTVFLEAAASGLPVVAGRVGGVEEAVEHLTTGIVVDVHQDKAVVGSIVELLKNSTYAQQMGEAGRKRVLREFTWEKQIQKLGN